MNPSLVDIVLVRPKQPGNVAAACRAMKNMGLGTLRVVDPPPGLDDFQARSLAYGAWDVLDSARYVASLREATSTNTLVVGTSGRPSADDWAPRRFATEAAERAGSGRIAIVFGPEASGLRLDELALCHLRVRIPTHSTHSSLNLAQAVLVMGYEILLSSPPGAPERIEPRPVAAAGQIEAALDELRTGLTGIGYLNPACPDAVLSELRALLVRSRPSPREVTLLRGLARQIRWAGIQIAQRGSGTDNGAPLGRGRK